MNQGDWISLAVALGVAAVGYWASESLKTRILWLSRPLLQWLVPVFRMEPWLFEPIAVDDLPPKQQKHFETHTPGFIARGFMHLGDVVLRRDPAPSCVRFFLSRDAATIGGINWYLDQKGIECISVLLDGFYIESSNNLCPQLPPQEHGLQFCCLNTDDAVALIEHHAACVAKAAADRKTQTATLEPTDLAAVVNYGRGLAMQSLKQQGVLEELPAFLQRKSREPDESEYSLAAR